MRKIDNISNEIYRFMNGDKDLTARRIEKGKYTEELYNKDQIIDVLEAAVKTEKCKSVIKKTNNLDICEYIFRFYDEGTEKSQLVTLQVPNSVSSISVDINGEKIEQADQYIQRLDKLKLDAGKVKLKKNLKDLGMYLGTGIVVAAMLGSIIITDMKEHENHVETMQKYVDEINMNREKNGVEPIYDGLLYTDVEEINELSGGRKL